MQLTSTLDPPPADSGSLRTALSIAPLARFSRGLLATGLIEDVQDGGPFTLLAPTNEAFEGMPWSFYDLLFDDRLLEPRFDLFEYLVVPGRVGVEGVRTPHPTLQGRSVRLGKQLAFGCFGAARILQSLETELIVVHVLEQCIFPWDPKLCLTERVRSLEP